MNFKNTLRLLIILCLAVIVTIFAHFKLYEFLTISKLSHYQAELIDYRKLHQTHLIIAYIVVYIALITACIPGTIILDIAAGLLFGTYLGSILVISCYSLGAASNFLIIRYLLHDFVKNRFTHFKHIIAGRGHYGILLNLISLRLVAIIPFWIINIVAAIADVRFLIFFIATIIGIIPTSVIYVIIGHDENTLISAHHQFGLNIIWQPQILIPLIVFALLLLLPNILPKSHKYIDKQ